MPLVRPRALYTENDLYQRLQRAIRLGLARVEKIFDAVFGAGVNPLYHLGALTFFFFWIVLASGIYLYIFFDTSTVSAFRSVEYLTREQWYAGGVLRSLHRYASDAMVLTMLLHLLREFVLDRHRGVRWFSWVTGVPPLWLVFFSGVNGYWLVWDRLAQYVAVASSEWLDWLGIFGEPIARNFFNQGSVSDRFFTLLMFLHIGVPLFLLAFSWLHLTRLSRPRTTPPAALMLGSLAALLALAIIAPALSQGPADLDTAPATVSLDWFFLFVYPLFDTWGYGAVWALVGGLTLVVCALPWLAPGLREPVALVDPPNCNGCGRCFADCPYGAVVMQSHPTKPGHQLAVVSAELCAACGICAGACPSSTPFRSAAELVTGIDMPQLSVHGLRAQLDEALAQLRGEAVAPGVLPPATPAHPRAARVVVFGCDHAADVHALREPGVATFSLMCAAQLPPSFVDYILKDGRADGVLVTGCVGADCYFRLGNSWVEQRLRHEREPHLRSRAARERVKLFWAGVADFERLRRELVLYREVLRARKPAPPRLLSFQHRRRRA